jgi:oligopeptide/dipeptide ABC transporter ATP-binding protein
MGERLVEVRNLKINYELGNSSIHAVDDVSFEVRKGERLGLVGESGSGKTTVAKSILKLLPVNAKFMGGNIFLKDKDITGLNEKEMDQIRWKEISLVTQSAMNALNPVARISDQMVDTFLAHIKVTKEEALNRSKQLFGMVGLNANRIFDYPHQFSGGMRQRVIIAMAIALNPLLIIADEPTTALDVIMQAQIINLLESLSEKQGISLILITHDISIVAEICQTIGVMYSGRLMEYGDIQKVFNSPYHPYTMGLKGAFPSIREIKKSLISIPGNPPLLIDRLLKCAFSERCPFSTEQCEREIPETISVEENHYVACHRIQHADQFRKEIKDIFENATRS